MRACEKRWRDMGGGGSSAQRSGWAWREPEIPMSRISGFVFVSSSRSPHFRLRLGLRLVLV